MPHAKRGLRGDDPTRRPGWSRVGGEGPSESVGKRRPTTPHDRSPTAGDRRARGRLWCTRRGRGD